MPCNSTRRHRNNSCPKAPTAHAKSRDNDGCHPFRSGYEKNHRRCRADCPPESHGRCRCPPGHRAPAW
ncbi:MAG: hypothetical protein J5532_03650 [Lachnospiraceae bacterium]|nr:hypothetical protein [Lachnospiraceae bacterium]